MSPRSRAASRPRVRGGGGAPRTGASCLRAHTRRRRSRVSRSRSPRGGLGDELIRKFSRIDTNDEEASPHSFAQQRASLEAIRASLEAMEEELMTYHDVI